MTNFATGMKPLQTLGLLLLALLWLWLCGVLFSTAGGFTLKNLLVAAMSGTIIFVPVFKKWFPKNPQTRKRP